MDSSKNKMDAGGSSSSSGAGVSLGGEDGAGQQGFVAEPDNRYYEVEEIIAGPKKRREHLFKVCYKVRWKGYGPDADTWQPIADLANVPEMIEEYKAKKAVEARANRKKKPKQKSDTAETTSKGKGSNAPSDRDSDEEQGLYDPEYGTVKDKFWKDLELGRMQNHVQLFSGDMYSKVKGCRRAAHAEAVANIQKQQQQLSAKSPPLSSPSPLSPPKSLQKEGRFRGKATPTAAWTVGDEKGLSSTRSGPSLSSKTVWSSPTTQSPKQFPGIRSRKRSSDPFSARGYMSAKRSRRSRVIKGTKSSSGGQRPSVSSVTSETVGIITTSSPVTPPVMPNISMASLFSVNTSDSTMMSQASTSDDCVKDGNEAATPKTEFGVRKNEAVNEVFMPGDQGSQMVVSSETILTVTTETRRLDTIADINPVMEVEKVKKDAKFLLTPSSLDDGASGDSITSGTVLEATGATPSGSVPDLAEVDLSLAFKRSALDAQMEAGGAVETGHSHECLWNGACNRSDCKSNRRRNMKRGNGSAEPENKDEREGESTSGTTESTSTSSSASERGAETRKSSETSSDRSTEKNTSSEEKKPPRQRAEPTSTFSRDSKYTSQTSSSTSQEQKGGGKGNNTNSSSLSSGQARRSLFSSTRGDSSDSSFDDSINNTAALSRDAVSDSFGRMGALAHRMHMDTLASSTATSKSLGAMGGRKSGEIERPGLFSDNNSAFNFSRQDSGFSGDSLTPGELQGQFMLPSPTGSINLSSPGKENFGSTGTKLSGSQGSDIFTRLQSTVEVDAPDTHSNSVSNTTQSSSGQTRHFTEPSDGRAARKRANEISQPLEKIPSPNSRDSDLDRRISTLTCDELEDFVEQGDERYGHKDVGYITNADLLQAVNLDKAEVVKHAIRQSSRNDQKLDFEQPDNTGATLLMKAIQKGNFAETEMLLEYGVNVNTQQMNGTTALMIAAEQNNPSLVAILLKHGANSSLYSVHGDQAETALMKAIKRQHPNVVSLMLRVGVNVAAPTCTSLSALELAMERRNPLIERIIRAHCQRLEEAFRNRVSDTLEGTAELLEPLFPMQCFPLRESEEFVVKFNSNVREVARGEGFLLFIAHTKITEKGVRCRFHGGCPIGSVTLNGVPQSPLTKEVNFVTSCHPIVQGCNTLVIRKLADYTSKAKLVVQAFGARLLS